MAALTDAKESVRAALCDNCLVGELDTAILDALNAALRDMKHQMAKPGEACAVDYEHARTVFATTLRWGSESQRRARAMWGRPPRS